MVHSGAEGPVQSEDPQIDNTFGMAIAILTTLALIVKQAEYLTRTSRSGCPCCSSR